MRGKYSFYFTEFLRECICKSLKMIKTDILKIRTNFKDDEFY